ncbi:serine-pyruvate aminotransferase/archaeal aspartate aminotransferase [Candidatus Methanoperedens nitroreducens]|uniref:Serine-pyruvate aminotransferase/archaeal aspartate aminotransferase n=1 Tax=Candidatus Methanoperedens nitratireducens TaxID=1392998 RepID=A0A062V8C6_9EURY|nr:alanine--glyoxylate aminotransferase family protein [Candidatus Methanoperedens nitroreducens]KCZ72823.1 serine-pyruvate aminotransferase/archaeal aspartate aminotransferase [Candidatus Methanoperedens nitroreducens]MDJ1423246.1 alanine--glyoxylate aminotransferase family protein [Candidatus Methanoperedens sp.]
MNLENTLLMIPGPVPVAPRILRAMSKPIIGHRGKEFGDMYSECRHILSELFATKNDIFIISGSGSCAMEAAVGNVIGENDTLVTIENGKFGERFREIGERYGKVRSVKFDWTKGESIELDRVEDALDAGAKAVTLVHNDTSVGIKNPAKEVGALAKKYGALFIMDGVTTIGGDEVLVDKWGVDLAVVGSQKCIGAPPGLSAISVSKKAWDSIVERPPYYMDLKAYRKSASKEIAQTPYTPAVPLFFALHEALRIIKEEGLEARIKRHARFAEAIRAAADAMDVEMFPQLNEYSRYSNTVTAMKIPTGIDDKKLRGGIKDLGIQVSGGQGPLEGKIFRIGSMGNISKLDILSTIQTVELVLHKNDVVKKMGTGVEAASNVLK